MKDIKHNRHIYLRHSIVSIEQVFDEIRLHSRFYAHQNGQLIGDHNNNTKALINGLPVNVSSLRLRSFVQNGLVCAGCGIKATHFALERFPKQNHEQYHLNLYALVNDNTVSKWLTDETRQDLKEILFTHDHILARALGGKDHLSNTQTMCCYCNWEKGDEEQTKVIARRKKK